MNYTHSSYIGSFDTWEEQKNFFSFTDADARYLVKLHSLAQLHCEAIVDRLYEYLLRFEDVRVFLNNDAQIKRLKLVQKQYFMELTNGEYGQDYYEKRIKVGIVHKRLGIPPRLYLGAYAHYLELIGPLIYQNSEYSQNEANQIYSTLVKIINIDQALTLSAYVHEVEEVIQQQTDEIIAMSTPIIQIWEGVVAAPIIGTLDSQRTQQFMEHLLNKIVETKASVALIDITGVPQIDTSTAQHLIDTINAVKLLGSKVIITGIRPAIAQTLVHLGIDLKGVITKPSMGAGLKTALELQVLRPSENSHNVN
jgi:rsbT co-antagonist protein RsbR